MKLLVSVLIFAGVLCASLAQIERPTSGPLLVKPKMAKMFKWFDGLDFDAVRNGQFVRLKSYSLVPDDARYEYGFLLSPTTILTLDLNLSRKAPDKPDLAYMQGPSYLDFMSFETADFAGFANSQLPILYGKDPNDKRRLVQGDVEALVMARACSARGAPELAEKYFVWATKSRYRIDPVSGKQTVEVTGPLPNGQREEGRLNGEWVDLSGYNNVEHDIARGQYVYAVQSLSDTRQTWRQRLKAFQRVQGLFGDVDAKDPASEYVQTLTKMVTETPEPDDSAHEIDRLIQQLPIENAHQFTQPGRAQVFNPLGGTSNDSPAHKLARIGRPAVPKLLAALDDQRLTQSIEGDWRGQYVLRVSDIVIQILNQIAGREFQVQVNPWRKLTKDEIRAAVRAWYDASGKDGELNVLKADLLANGGFTTVNKINEQYPAKARDIFIEALKKNLPSATRSYLLQQIAFKLDAVSIPVLKNEALHGGLTKDRIYAAGRLTSIDRAFSSTVLVKELAAHRDPEGFSFDDHFPDPSIYECLIMNGSPNAIAALAKGLQDRPVEVRSEILRNYDKMFPPEADTTSKALTEALLVSELLDPDTEPVHHEVNDRDFRSSMEDLAAADLGKLFPSKYPYREFRFEADRERQRLQFANIWRTAHAMPPIPDTAKAVRPVVNKSIVAAVEISGETPSNSKIAALTRNLTGEPMTFDGFLSVAKSMDELKMPKGRYARLLITREAAGDGLTVHLDFYRHGSGDVGGSGPLTRFHARIGEKMIEAPQWGFSIDSHKDQFATCLAAPAGERIDVEYDYWTVN